MTGETDNTVTNLKEEITETTETTEITELTIETLIEEETMVRDHKEDNNQDMNQEEKNSEKELPFNGAKLIKSVQEIKNLISSSR